MLELFTALSQPELPALTLAIGLLIGTFISEDVACILAAGAVAGGRLSFAAAAAACFAGIFVGDLMLYGAGRLVGETILQNRFVKRLVTHDRISNARSWYEHNAASAILISRFISGLRLPTYLLAGAVEANFGKFSLYIAIAGVVWTPLLIAAVVWAQSWLFAGKAAIGLIAAFLLLQMLMRYTKHENRRLLVGWIRRLVKWEFWPVQVFYIPVVFYIVLLAIRYRSITVFTAANPCLPAGGFKGESKHEIYRMLSAAWTTSPSMLAHIRLPKGLDRAEKLRRTRDFMNGHAFDFPVVIKPDIGERGRGVAVVRDLKQLDSILERSSGELIVQEFCDGVEASVFYYREPDKRHGLVYSITEKMYPSLVGDGVSTLKELILADKRAVCLAMNYFRENAEKLSSIPAKGECVQLIEIGTHSRGAIFLDGEWLRSSELEARVDEICRSLPGFYFGRFDLRAATFDDLRNGKFKIIELNGVTSESTNIYDPRYSLRDAYRILFRQWKLAFSIGAANHARGVPITRFSDLIRLGLGMKPASIRPPEHKAMAN